MHDSAVHNSLYNDALLYDILHTPGTARELDGVERAAARFVRTKSRRLQWLEPACGSGRCLRLAARRGSRILGFDLNPAMVDYARATIERAGLAGLARAETEDMRTFVDTGACREGSVDVAFNIINTFRHLMTDADALAHFRQIHRALKPGGVYILGISTCCYALEGPTEDTWRARRGGLALTQTVQYIPPTGPRGGSRVERVFSHLAVQRGQHEDHLDTAYRLRTYSLAQLTTLIERSPLAWVGTADQSGDEDAPAESGYRLLALARSRD
jgi:SAM-dependent methyltransferase